MLAEGLARKAQEFLFRRRTAYLKVFRLENAYGREVLEDLFRFCRAGESTFHPDPRAEARLDGRREVWLRIQHHIQLTPEQLWDIYSGTPRREHHDGR